MKLINYVLRFISLDSSALFLFLLSLYLLTYTPRINSSDGLAMFSTAESLVRRGALDIEQIRWMGLQQGAYGLDGLLYSRKGIGVPIALLPLTWLGLALSWSGTVSLSLLFNPIITAATAVLLMAYLHRLGYTRRTGLIAGLVFGLCTLAWPYAKSLFSDPFSGFLLLSAAYTLHPPTPLSPHLPISLAPLLPRPPAPLLYPFLAGLLLGWNVATRYAAALFVPVYGLLLLYYLARGQDQKKELIKSFPNFWLPLLAFAIPLLAVAAGLISFNLSRYGDPFNTGYLPEETFSGRLWEGIAGQLISPGRGLLLYSPIFILSFWGLIPFLRRFRAEGLLAVAIILIHLLLYGKWFMWHGGYAWGPRFMIPTLPFWSLLLAPIVARIFSDQTLRLNESSVISNIRSPITNYRLPITDYQLPITNYQSLTLRYAFFILAALSLIPQLLSVLIDFSPFQNSLLETGLPLFDPLTFFDPRFSPFVAAWGFISLDSLDLAWAWRGQLNVWLLAILLLNLFIAGWNLKRSRGAGEQGSREAGEQGSKGDREMGRWGDGEKSASPITNYQLPITNYQLLITSPLSTLIAAVLLLAYSHTLPAGPFQEAVLALNEAVEPADAVVTNDPEVAIAFAELYKGRAPVLGLNSGGLPLPDDVTRRLDQLAATHPLIWWLPNWLPPEESGVEQSLLAAGFKVRDGHYNGQRLVLFA
jgi:hypothetical protein